MEERILAREIEDEMKTSYIDYAMSVLVGRALPDVRDGLKPVHRRILYSMLELGLQHNKPFRKCARIVGDCLGKYHPHGDSAVYDSLVRMAQDFSLMYPLVDGQGNFGSVDGDNAAAMRYTEARMSKIAEELLEDIDAETVDFTPNFDGSLKEPVVLPSKFPNLLINGSSGIAVGMATNIPPHNLGEVSDAIVMQIDNPEISNFELMSVVKGPDFPTAGTICGTSGIRHAYETGKGILRVRAKAEIEEEKGKARIIVNEIPFQVNKAVLVEEIADLIRDKVIFGISDLRDESDRDGMRIVIELKKDANPQVVLNQLFSHSRLESTFGINMIALVGNQPKILSLREIIAHFIAHRKEVVIRRTKFEFEKASDRAHILEGIIIALRNIDEVISRIRAAKDTDMAKLSLMASFSLTEKQSLAILDMKLQRLSSLEQQKVKDEHLQLLERIKELKEILESEKLVLGIIKKELIELKQKYGKPRKTEIVALEQEYTDEDLVKSEDMVITMSHSGYVKRMPLDAYREQKRGGKGMIAASTREGDFIEHVFIANTHSYILFFTDKGRVHWLKVFMIPEASRQSMGKAIVNLLEIEGAITAFVPVKEFKEGYNLVMATKNGVVKKTELMAYSNPRKGGIIAITLDENDSLINVGLTDGTNQIILATKNGMAVRFNETDIRSTGRSARGVLGIRLREDEVIGMVIVDETKALLTVTENGYGKRSSIEDYRLISRGGYGVINIQTTDRNGKVVSVMSVHEHDALVFISRRGIMIKVPANGISVIGRNTQGARIMRLEADDKVVSSSVIGGNGSSQDA
jgi:DNA gyrase subunit A